MRAHRWGCLQRCGAPTEHSLALRSLMCLHLCLQSADFGEAFMALRPAARLLWYRKLYEAANEQVWPCWRECAPSGFVPACPHRCRFRAFKGVSLLSTSRAGSGEGAEADGGRQRPGARQAAERGLRGGRVLGLRKRSQSMRRRMVWCGTNGGVAGFGGEK